MGKENHYQILHYLFFTTFFQRIIKQAEIDKMSRELDCLYEKQRRFNEDIYDKSQYGLAEVGYLE